MRDKPARFAPRFRSIRAQSQRPSAASTRDPSPAPGGLRIRGRRADIERRARADVDTLGSLVDLQLRFNTLKHARSGTARASPWGSPRRSGRHGSSTRVYERRATKPFLVVAGPVVLRESRRSRRRLKRRRPRRGGAFEPGRVVGRARSPGLRGSERGAGERGQLANDGEAVRVGEGGGPVRGHGLAGHRVVPLEVVATAGTLPLGERSIQMRWSLR
jgi:hypothetical protein